MVDTGSVLVVGAGPGLGLAVARRFAREGFKVAIAARSEDRLKQRANEEGLKPYACDATDPAAVERLFAEVTQDLGAPRVVIYNAGTFEPGRVVDIAPEDFERCWRIGCYGGFLVGRAAAASMKGRGGTILLTGATASLRGGAGFANLAVPKFGLRALSQSLARELGPENIHVAHVIIDGQIDSPRRAHLKEERGPDSLLDPDAIAESYYQLHRQHRSAWTQELDLRPWVESF